MCELFERQKASICPQLNESRYQRHPPAASSSKVAQDGALSAPVARLPKPPIGNTVASINTGKRMPDIIFRYNPVDAISSTLSRFMLKTTAFGPVATVKEQNRSR